jgi:proteasome lid subunit RPN8/RPN11
MAPASVSFHETVLDTMALLRGPSETCGLLIGRTTASHTHVSSIHVATNRALQTQRRFKIDATDLLAAAAAAQAEAHELVGVFHTHPEGSASPSPLDAAHAALWSPMLWVIQGRESDLGAFLIEASGERWRRVRVVSSVTP